MDPRYSRYFIYIKPIFKNTYVKTYSSLIFSLIAITFFGLFAIRPTFKTIISLQKEIEQQKLVLVKLTEKSQNLELGRKNLQAIDFETKDKLEALLPNKVAPVSLIDDLTALVVRNEASVSGLQLQPFEMEENPKSLNQKSDLKELEFTLNVQGKYPQLATILNLITQTSHSIIIESVAFNKLDTGLVMSVNAKTFY